MFDKLAAETLILAKENSKIMKNNGLIILWGIFYLLVGVVQNLVLITSAWCPVEHSKPYGQANCPQYQQIRAEKPQDDRYAEKESAGAKHIVTASLVQISAGLMVQVIVANTNSTKPNLICHVTPELAPSMP
jgi:hypothetical protein